MSGPFQWASPLGVGVGLFLATAALHFLIGVLTPIAIRTFAKDDDGTLIVSRRSDTQTFGRPPADMIADEPAIRTYRNVMWTIVGGFLVGAAVLEAAVTWFGLKAGATWALAVLAIEGVTLAAFWWLALAPYLSAKAPLTFADLPPFMWVPAVLLLPATILSWMGLRG